MNTAKITQETIDNSDIAVEAQANNDAKSNNGQPCGLLWVGRAEDGKLKSNLEWHKLSECSCVMYSHIYHETLNCRSNTYCFAGRANLERRWSSNRRPFKCFEIARGQSSSLWFRAWYRLPSCGIITSELHACMVCMLFWVCHMRLALANTRTGSSSWLSKDERSMLASTVSGHYSPAIEDRLLFSP